MFYFGMESASGSSDSRVSGNQIEIKTSSDIEYHIIADIDFSKNYIITINDISQEVSFCNNDGTCQPCFEGLCSNIENHLTCPSDCPSGGSDNYCDLKLDGICDSDCSDYDFDCDECMDNICLYDGMELQSISCSAMGGNVCSAREICSGYETYADDVGMNCCIGECQYESVQEDSASIPSHSEETSSDEEYQYEEYQDIELGNGFFVQDEPSQNIDIYLYGMGALIVLTFGVMVIAQVKTFKSEKQIKDYVKSMLNSGYEIGAIETALLQQGHQKDVVEKICGAFKK